MCLARKKLINRQTCRLGYPLEQRNRGKVLPILDIAYGGLGDADASRKLCLRQIVRFAVLGECSHMSAPKTIGTAYDLSIGRSYSNFVHASFMAKQKQRTVLERALEALSEKYPKKKPTQTRLAELAGVSQPTVNEWGEPDRYPSMPTAVKLSRELDICVEWLLTERGPKYATLPEPTLDPLLTQWRGLRDEQRAQLARFAEFMRDDSKK